MNLKDIRKSQPQVTRKVARASRSGGAPGEPTPKVMPIAAAVWAQHLAHMGLTWAWRIKVPGTGGEVIGLAATEQAARESAIHMVRGVIAGYRDARDHVFRNYNNVNEGG